MKRRFPKPKDLRMRGTRYPFKNDHVFHFGLPQKLYDDAQAAARLNMTSVGALARQALAEKLRREGFLQKSGGATA